MPTELWDRRPDESPPAFQAFQTYRDLGPDRSIALVHTELRKSASILGRWSARHEWIDRAASWDDRTDEARQGTYLEAISDMADRQALNAQRGMAVLMLPVEELLRRATSGEIEWKLLSLPELLTVSRLSAVAMAGVAGLERLARGQAPGTGQSATELLEQIAGAEGWLVEKLAEIAEAREREEPKHG